MRSSDFDKGFTVQVRPNMDTGKYQLRVLWYDDADSVEESILPTEYDSLNEASIAATEITTDVIRGWADVDGVPELEMVELIDPDDIDDAEMREALYADSLSVLRSLISNMEQLMPPTSDYVLTDEVAAEFDDMSSEFLKGLLFGLPVSVAAIPILNEDNLGAIIPLAAVANIITSVLARRGDM